MDRFPELDLQGIAPVNIKWIASGYGFSRLAPEDMQFDVCVMPHGADPIHGWVQVALCDSCERAEDVKVHIDRLSEIARRLIGG